MFHRAKTPSSAPHYARSLDPCTPTMVKIVSAIISLVVQR